MPAAAADKFHILTAEETNHMSVKQAASWASNSSGFTGIRLRLHWFPFHWQCLHVGQHRSPIDRQAYSCIHISTWHPKDQTSLLRIQFLLRMQRRRKYFQGVTNWSYGMVTIKYFKLDLDSSYCNAPLRTQIKHTTDIARAIENRRRLLEKYELAKLLTHSFVHFTWLVEGEEWVHLSCYYYTRYSLVQAIVMDTFQEEWVLMLMAQRSFYHLLQSSPSPSQVPHGIFCLSIVSIKYCKLDLDSSCCIAPHRTQIKHASDITRAKKNRLGLPEKLWFS